MNLQLLSVLCVPRGKDLGDSWWANRMPCLKTRLNHDDLRLLMVDNQITTKTSTNRGTVVNVLISNRKQLVMSFTVRKATKDIHNSLVVKFQVS